MTTTAKFPKFLAALAVTTLTVTGCSSDDGASPEADQLDQLLAAEARDDQRAAGGATMMAMDLGFDQVQPAAAADLTAVRDKAADPAEVAAGLTVDPVSCAEPVAKLDWSPILASSESITRVDFSKANFQGAGSIEVAGITEATGGSSDAETAADAHLNAVQRITSDCSNLTMMLADESEPDWAEVEYTFEAEALETDSGAGLRWQRYPTDDPQRHMTTALTLMTEQDGYAIMVAFIGGSEIADEEFVDIADAILASAVAQID